MLKKILRPLIAIIVVASLAGAAWLLWTSRSVETQYAVNKEAGVNLAAEGSFAEAEARLQESLEAARKLGPDDQRVDEVLTELAEVYQAQGKYVDSQHVTFESLERAIAKHGPEHPETGVVFNELGHSYELQNVYEPAEGMYNQAIAIWEKLDAGSRLEDRAFSYRGLARVLAQLDRGGEAARAYGKALEIEEKRLGQDDPQLAPLLREYARVLEKTGNEAEAASFAARADRLAPPTPTPTITDTPTLTPTETQPPTPTPQPTDTPAPPTPTQKSAGATASPAAASPKQKQPTLSPAS